MLGEMLPILKVLVAIVLTVAVLWTAFKIIPDIRSWEDESREKALIAVVLLATFAGGVYLVDAVSAYADIALQASAFRIASLWALAYAGAGFLAGFLFGIPRVLQGQDGAAAPAGSAAGQSTGYAQRVNTNLEQISDWLTKIIVGIGLVELRQVPEHLYKASMWMASSFSLEKGDEFAQAASFSNSVILYFSVAGFLAGYIITRVYLAGAFGRADIRAGILTTAEPLRIKDADKANVEKLRSFWKPDGSSAKPENEKRLLDWLTESGLNTPEKPASISSFLYLAEYAKERAKAVGSLGL